MAAAARSMSVQEAVEGLGFGRFQKLLLAVCGVTWAADGAEVLLLGVETKRQALSDTVSDTQVQQAETISV
jgi:hypothetical protein